MKRIRPIRPIVIPIDNTKKVLTELAKARGPMPIRYLFFHFQNIEVGYKPKLGELAVLAFSSPSLIKTWLEEESLWVEITEKGRKVLKEGTSQSIDNPHANRTTDNVHYLKAEYRKDRD